MFQHHDTDVNKAVRTGTSSLPCCSIDLELTNFPLEAFPNPKFSLQSLYTLHDNYYYPIMHILSASVRLNSHTQDLHPSIQLPLAFF